jgi:hydroxymethylbilane synthase
VTTIRIGTRGSQLALWQANTVARLITERGGPACELVIVRTSGDERPGGPPDPPIAETPPRTPSTASLKSTFVKEIEDALIEGRIDLAVHSSKDLSAVLPEGVTIAATLAREDARDAMLLPHGEPASSLKTLEVRLGRAPRIGTSSVRRTAQLRTLFPEAAFAPIRGNVDTRLRKLDNGSCDAAVLACAGLKRLGLAARISLPLPLDICVPAPGQGIVAIQVRDDQPTVRAAVAAISDSSAFDALIAERAVVRVLGGGCQMPLGAHAHIEDDELSLTTVVISDDARRVVRARASGPRAAAAEIGARAAESLLRDGAAGILGT